MIFISEHAYEPLIRELELIDELVLITSNPNLYSSVADHADLQVAVVDGQIYLSKDSHPSIQAALINKGTPCVVLETGLAPKYPQSAPLCGVYTEDLVLANPKTLAKGLLACIEKKGTQLVAVKQGYTRCSCLPIGPTSFITDDEGIDRAINRAGYRSLLIKKGHVILVGHPYGFIGGCGGMVRDTLYLNGDLSSHPDENLIRSFCDGHKVKIKDMKGYPLKDIGSIIWADP